MSTRNENSLVSDGRNRHVTAATVAGAVLAAFAASACCVGPLVLALLGLGGGALLVKFEPYRPYFMAATVAMLGAGFYLTYRKPNVASAVEGDSCGCAMPRASRAGRVMLWIAAAVVVVFLAFPYLAPMIFN